MFLCSQVQPPLHALVPDFFRSYIADHPRVLTAASNVIVEALDATFVSCTSGNVSIFELRSTVQQVASTMSTSSALLGASIAGVAQGLGAQAQALLALSGPSFHALHKGVSSSAAVASPILDSRISLVSSTVQQTQASVVVLSGATSLSSCSFHA